MLAYFAIAAASSEQAHVQRAANGVWSIAVVASPARTFVSELYLNQSAVGLETTWGWTWRRQERNPWWRRGEAGGGEGENER